MVNEQLPSYNRETTPFTRGQNPINYGRSVKPEAQPAFKIFTREDAARATGQLTLGPIVKPSELGADNYWG